MTLMLNLPDELENRLKNEAERRGVAAPELARQLIEAGLHVDVELQKKLNQSTLDLLAKWNAETEMPTPDELERRNREWAEFQAGMNRNRVESEGAGARIPYPCVGQSSWIPGRSVY
jgi:hypothetical protein